MLPTLTQKVMCWVMSSDSNRMVFRPGKARIKVLGMGDRQEILCNSSNVDQQRGWGGCGFAVIFCGSGSCSFSDCGSGSSFEKLVKITL